MGGTSRGLATCLLISLLTLAPDAWAYLDPSTGSMILSAIVGMFATAALAIKTYWYKLKGLFRSKEREQPRTPEQPDERKPSSSRPAD